MAFRKQRMGRKKVCYFTKNKITYIDYKDVELLKRFVSARMWGHRYWHSEWRGRGRMQWLLPWMALRGGLRMETVDVYTERGDLVTCSDCGKVMLLPYGADKCPACKKEGCLVWTDESLREADIDSLLERHCNLHQKSELQPESNMERKRLCSSSLKRTV